MKEKLLSAFASLGNTVFAAVPKVAVGLLLLVLGLLAAKLIEVVLRTMLVRLRFDKLVEKAGIDQALQKNRPASAAEPIPSQAGLLPGFVSTSQDS